MTLPAGTPIGKYVVRRKIAEGGMAEIYLCASKGPEGFEKEVVIKRIRAFLATDQSFVEMFIREAQLASWLNHPNIVQIFDFDKHEDTYYLAMEYVHGRSLWELRKKTKELLVPVPPVLVAHIGSEVARALHFAHQLKQKGKPVGIVHRDVTPHNVLLSFDGAVKLTDFGIAKVDKTGTAPGMLKGKFAYMSPEQARGDAVDARTDVFALGIVLWEMLTGGRLFDADSELGTLKAVQQSVIPPPSRVNPDVPDELSAVVLKALERDVAARYATAQDLERALKQFVLHHADDLDDTDVGGYLRKLFPEESTQVRGMSISLSSITPPNAQAEPPPPPPPAPEKTAVKGKPFTPPPRPTVESTNVLDKPAGSPPTARLPSVGKKPAEPPATVQQRSVRRASNPEIPAVEDTAPAGADPTLIVRRASIAAPGSPVSDDGDAVPTTQFPELPAPDQEAHVATVALPRRDAGAGHTTDANDAARSGLDAGAGKRTASPVAGGSASSSGDAGNRAGSTQPIADAATTSGAGIAGIGAAAPGANGKPGARTSAETTLPLPAESAEAFPVPPTGSPSQSGPSISLHTSAGAAAPRPQPGSPGFAQVRAEVERSAPPRSSRRGLYVAAAVFIVGVGIAVAVGVKSASSKNGGGGEGSIAPLQTVEPEAVLPQKHDAGSAGSVFAVATDDTAAELAVQDAGARVAAPLEDEKEAATQLADVHAGRDAGSAQLVDARGGRDAGSATVAQVSVKRMGILKLSVVPWAKVSIDGVSRGEIQSPRTFSLEAGEHRLKLDHPRGAKTQKVTILSGQTTPVIVNMLQQ